MQDGDAHVPDQDGAAAQPPDGGGRPPNPDAWSATSIWAPGVHRAAPAEQPEDEAVEAGATQPQEASPAEQSAQSWDAWSEPFADWSTEPVVGEPTESARAQVEPQSSVDMPWEQGPLSPPDQGTTWTAPSDEPPAPAAPIPWWAADEQPEQPGQRLPSSREGDQPPTPVQSYDQQPEPPTAPDVSPQPGRPEQGTTPSWAPQGGWPSEQSAAYWPATEQVPTDTRWTADPAQQNGTEQLAHPGAERPATGASAPPVPPVPPAPEQQQWPPATAAAPLAADQAYAPEPATDPRDGSLSVPAEPAEDPLPAGAQEPYEAAPGDQAEPSAAETRQPEQQSAPAPDPDADQQHTDWIESLGPGEDSPSRPLDQLERPDLAERPVGETRLDPHPVGVPYGHDEADVHDDDQQADATATTWESEPQIGAPWPAEPPPAGARPDQPAPDPAYGNLGWPQQVAGTPAPTARDAAPAAQQPPPAWGRQPASGTGHTDRQPAPEPPREAVRYDGGPVPTPDQQPPATWAQPQQNQPQHEPPQQGQLGGWGPAPAGPGAAPTGWAQQPPAQQPGGFRGSEPYGTPGQQSFPPGPPTNANDFAAQRALAPEPAAPTRGLPGFMHRATGGRAHLSLSPAERLEREQLAAIRANFPGVRQITFVNPKGGSAKTTAALLTAMTFGQSRGGYVLAWDNNETQGTLGVRSQPDRHQRTVRDLLDDLPTLGPGRVGDLSVYVRSQGEAMFDVLASDEQATAGEMMTADAFEAVRDVVSRFYRVICVDTGNNVRAENWASAIASTDQLVVTSSVRWESAYSASRMLDHLEQTGKAELVRNAVTVLTLPRKHKQSDIGPVESHFRARTRTVLHAPFDPLLDQGDAIAYAKLEPETRKAYLAIAAAIAEGLNGPQPSR